MNGLKTWAAHAILVVATIGAGAVHAAVVYTSSASFFGDLTAANATVFTETYEGLALDTLIPQGSTVNAFTYTSLPLGLDGIVGSIFNDLGTRSLQLDRNANGAAGGGDFFFPSESITLTFAPSNAFGVFLNVVSSTTVTDYLTLVTAAGAVTGGGATPDTSTFFFLGIISDTPFSSATFGATPASPSGYNVDNPTIASIPEPASALLLGTALLGLALRRRLVR